jgi:hypothetical protein
MGLLNTPPPIFPAANICDNFFSREFDFLHTQQNTSTTVTMPKSKRAKVVHLSKVEKKGKEHTEKLYNGVREAADEYPFIYVFRVDNMRNTYLKEVRTEFGDSRYVILSLRHLCAYVDSRSESLQIGVRTYCEHNS